MGFKQWKKYIIDDVCTVTDCLHKTAPAVDYETQYRMLRTTNIRNGKIDAINTRSVTKETYLDWTVRGILEEDDVILTREAPMGEVGIIKNEQYNLFLGQRLLQLKVNREIITPDFLYYSLQGRELQHQIGMNEGTGSVVSNIRIPVLKKMEIQVPNLEIQDEMTKSLRALDNKVEINEGIITNLEELAQTLFKRWFVDFEFPNENGEPYKSSGGEMVESELGMIPSNWSIEELKNIAKQVGSTVKVQELDQVLPHIGLAHMPRGSIALSEWETSEAITSNKTSFEKNDILFGKLRPYFKKVGIAPLTGICSTDIIVLNAIEQQYYTYLICLVSRDHFIDYCTATATGTRMPRTGWRQMSKYKIVKPPNEIGGRFNDLLVPFYEEISTVVHENTNLQKLRDTLLPKLLSGEITIPENGREV